MQQTAFNRHHIHTHPFNGPLSRTTQVSRYQKGKTNLDFAEARDIHTYIHTHRHPFNGPFSGTTQVSQYQKGKTNLGPYSLLGVRQFFGARQS